MKWSEHAWLTIEPIYQSIIEMPFIKELSDGHLPKEKFQFYMAQDSLYLEHFGRALALIAAKTHDVKDALTYTRFAQNAMVVEGILHESFFKDFGLTDRGTMQPACHHYVHFLRSTAALEAVEIGMAATLPCFWIYKKVGDYIYSKHQARNNPYQKWIDTYSGDEFSIAVQNAITSCDTAAAKTTPDIRTRMTEAFITSSSMEYDFWQAAYELKTWKVHSNVNSVRILS